MNARAASPLARLTRFFTVGIWEERPAELPPARSALLRASRIGAATVRGFFEDQLTVRAAALTYFSVLSVVPFLAFAFSILKGFGAYRAFVEGTVRPYLAETFSPNPALHQALERILGFVEATDFSRVGAIGLVLLLYTSVTLIGSVEGALNDVFGAKTTRPVLRQLTDYVTLLVTTPLLLLVAGTFSAAAQSSTAVLFVREKLGLGPLIDFAIGLAPVFVVGLALFAMYLILPNVRIRARSALLGAAFAAVGWQVSLVLHVQLQMGVARSNAIYSVLGALPIFLVWTYVSWLVVLVGAEIAASHQNEHALRQRLHGKRTDRALDEVLAIAIAARIARDFVDGAPRRTAAELAALLEVPPRAVEDVLDALVRAGLVVRVPSGAELGYAPARDLDSIRASDLRDALRRDPAVDPVRGAVERRLGADLHALVRAAERERRDSPNDLTLRELGSLVRDPGAPREDAGVAPPDDRDQEDVLDAKQPDLPH